MKTQRGPRTDAFDLSDPPSVSTLFVGAGDGTWEEAPAAGFRRRSLGGAEATQGWLDAWELIAAPGAGAGAGGWQARAGGFHALFVTAGSVRVEHDGGDIALGVGDVACVPGGYRHRLTPTPAARLIELGTPAGAGSGGELLVNREDPAAYDVGKSVTASRRFLAYRDVPVPAAAAGLVRLEVIRAHIGGHSSGWHFHPMAQIVFPVLGGALVDVEGHGTEELLPGTALYVGAGVRHNLREISDDYGLLEAFVPGIGGATQCDAPEGWPA